MSFSHDVKDELAGSYPERPCCKKAELAALVRAAGTLGVRSGGRLNTSISTEHPAVARKVFRLLKEVAGVRPEFIVFSQSRLRKGSRYVVRLGHPDARVLLDSLGFAKGRHLSYGIGKSIVGRQCCGRAYLRGFFLGRGSVVSPSRGNHLEMVAPNEVQARDIRGLLRSFGLNSSIVGRKTCSVVYMKEGEHIATFLNLIGAHSSLLNYENVRVRKEVMNRVNRLVNMETANINKIADASVRQVNDIRAIRSCAGLEALPASLRRIAVARLEHPEASLEELGDLMEPPLSKSAVNHRMRRIRRIARALERDRARTRLPLEDERPRHTRQD
ncbi:MAG: DNA-binding protein WhiA [Firmicutes bacterium]|jgi:DNA-binding protein WhiA|nr:DNA-binding protein WhiA [Bacillota bacterium]